MNLLTNYVDRTQKRLYRYKRSKKEIMVFSKEFYVNVMLVKQKKALLDGDVVPVYPFSVQEVSKIEIPDESFAENRRTKDITVLSTFNEKITAREIAISEGIVVLTDKVVTVVVLDSVEQALSGIDTTTIMTEEESEECDEDFEFI